MYIKAMEVFWVSPNEALIVEDSPHGIEAAKKSWWHLITVKNATEVHRWIFSAFFN
jgi:HAD superfamily hydrolase (TIGR01509 family)